MSISSASSDLANAPKGNTLASTAVALGGMVARHSLNGKVREYLDGLGLPGQSGTCETGKADDALDFPIAIACSGGADSVCLLLVMYAHFPELRRRMLVLHFDHAIRGEESARDCEFVRGLASQLGVSFESSIWREGSHKASEEAARKARMSFLHSKASVICFGHNQTDVAESFLFRLGRGSGPDGLAGPRAVQRIYKGRSCADDDALEDGGGIVHVHLRPLLDISGEDIRAALTRCNVVWREDSTNATLDYARNRIRHEVLPLLARHLGRDWAKGAARSRELVEEADAFIEEEALTALNSLTPNKGNGIPGTLPVALLRSIAQPVRRRVLQKWLSLCGLYGKGGAKLIERILAAVTSGTLHETELKSAHLIYADGALAPCLMEQTGPKWAPIYVPTHVESTIFFPDGASLKVEPISFYGEEAAELITMMKREKRNDRAVIAVNNERKLMIRLRQPGDRFCPLGMKNAKKMQDMMVDRKIALARRDELPIVLMGENGAITWVPGLPPSEEFRLFTDNRNALRLTYAPGHD